MIERLKMWLIWLRRCPNSRGFGIQSPSVYRFVRYVVNEHYPYYAYAELQRCYPNLGVVQRKLFLLYFRISNAFQPSVWLDYQDTQHAEPSYAARTSYIEHGCRKTHMVPFQSLEEVQAVKRIDVARMCVDHQSQEIYEDLLARMSDTSLLIVEGIYQTKESRQFWNMILQDSRTGITLDLYYCGLVFLDHVRTKRNYLINF